MEEDYYVILGVEKTATAEEIKRAYKKTAIKYHPDRNPGDKDAEEKFKQAAEAYDVLRDPDKRARYDQFGKAGVEGAAGGGAGFDGFSDIFSRFGDIFGDMGFDFGGFGRGQSYQSERKHQGGDLAIRVKLTLKEIATGVTKKFKVKKDIVCEDCHGTGCENGAHPTTCPNCHGSGVVMKHERTILGIMQTQAACPQCHGEGKIIEKPCKHCHGNGVKKGEEIIEIKIPAGVSEGMVVPIQRKGNAGKRNGIPGDIQVIINEEPHNDFVRDGQDLIYTLLLNVSQAVLGDTIEIPTIDGKAQIKIQPGTQPGTTLRLRGKGLPSVPGYGYGMGDIIVNVSVYIPEHLSSEEKNAFEKMKESDNLQADNQVKEKIVKTFRHYFDQ